MYPYSFACPYAVVIARIFHKLEVLMATACLFEAAVTLRRESNHAVRSVPNHWRWRGSPHLAKRVRYLINDIFGMGPMILLFCFLSLAQVFAGDNLPENQPITINVQNEPLGKVLEKIGADTGLAFSIDVQWKDVPVSVSLHQTPLHKGLKRILANLNNVIIYESDSKVKIVILGKIEPAKTVTGPAGLPRYQPTPAYQQPGPAETSEPEPEEPETPPESETAPDVEKDETTESDASAADEGEKTEEPAAEGTAEESSAEEKAPAEDTPEAPTEIKEVSPDADTATDKQSGG